MKLYIPKAATKPKPKYFVRLFEAKDTKAYSDKTGYVLAIVDEEGVFQTGGYLLTIDTNGVTRIPNVTVRLAKLAGVELDEKRQMVIKSIFE